MIYIYITVLVVAVLVAAWFLYKSLNTPIDRAKRFVRRLHCYDGITVIRNGSIVIVVHPSVDTVVVIRYTSDEIQMKLNDKSQQYDGKYEWSNPTILYDGHAAIEMIGHYMPLKLKSGYDRIDYDYS